MAIGAVSIINDMSNYSKSLIVEKNQALLDLAATDVYTSEYSVYGLLNLSKTTKDRLFFDKAVEIATKSINSPSVKWKTNIVDDLKGILCFGDLSTFGVSHFKVDTPVIRNHTTSVFNYWMNRPFGDSPTFRQWCLETHKKPLTTTEGFWHGHQSMASIISHGIGDFAYSKAVWDEFVKYRVIMIDGGLIWNQDKGDSASRDTWHSNREARMACVASPKSYEEWILAVTNRIWKGRTDKFGTPYFSEMIDGTGPAQGAIFEGWCKLAAYSPSMWDVSNRIYNRITKGPKSGTVYNLHTHPSGSRDLCFIGNIALAYYNKTW